MASYGEFLEETTTTTGTGAITLAGGGQSGSRTFLQEIPDGDYCEYTLRDANGVDFENGFGIFTAAGPTIGREFPIRSSNGNAAIVLTAGTHLVTQTATAMRFSRRGVRASADAATLLIPSTWVEIIFLTPVLNTDNMWSVGAPTKIIPPPWARALTFTAGGRMPGFGSSVTSGLRIGVDGVPTNAIGLPEILVAGQTDLRMNLKSGEVDITGVTDFSLLMRHTGPANVNPTVDATWIDVQPIP